MAGVGISLALSSHTSWAFAPNETVSFAMIGTGGRSYALLQSLSQVANVQLTYACDVDKPRLDAFITKAETYGMKVKAEKDFRKVLERKDVDAVIIATPEHWHAPMAIMAMNAGKHVYVEKPCSHNLFENELLIATQKKTGKYCQMGNQQRSAWTSQKAIQEIRDGKIGEVYSAKAWYSNTRKPIGTGKEIAVPETLDWELWQGPAPREAYRDNVHPYNWHWFRAWGTGEVHNNGTHEIDICRWALDVKFPVKVVSKGGRFFAKDDWQYFDTQLVNYEFAGGKTISWDGQSCNGHQQYGRGRGAIIYGTSGTIILDREGYELFDLGGQRISYDVEGNSGTSANTSDTSGFDELTVSHLRNFVAAIRTDEKLHAPIHDGAVSTHLCHLGNLAQDLQQEIKVDSSTGKVLTEVQNSQIISRTYAKGWEPKRW